MGLCCSLPLPPSTAHFSQYCPHLAFWLPPSYLQCVQEKNAILHISQQTTKSQPLRIKFAGNNVKQFGSNPTKFSQFWRLMTQKHSIECHEWPSVLLLCCVHMQHFTTANSLYAQKISLIQNWNQFLGNQLQPNSSCQLKITMCIPFE